MKLLPHNEAAYKSLVEMLKIVKRTYIVHPTGTGKSYIAMAYIKEHPDERILFITSYVTTLSRFAADIQMHFANAHEVFNHLDLTIYKGLGVGNIYDPDALTAYGAKSRLKPEKLDPDSYDTILLDEFHRVGAETWEKSVREMMPGKRVIGFSATPIRYLDDERDMGIELFGGNAASEITLHDALVNHLLPTPRYITCRYSLWDDFVQAEGELRYKWMTAKEKDEVAHILTHARSFLQNAEGLDMLFSSKMENPHGHYIVFCKNVEHLKQMKKESLEWFSWCDKVKYYEVWAGHGDTIETVKRFERDEDAALKLLFCVDMLNEGVHVKGIDGIIMLRPTESMIVYLQQLGRALAVGHDKRVQIFDIVNNARELEQGRSFWNGVIEGFMEKGEHYEDVFDIFGRDIKFTDLLARLEMYRKTDGWDYYYSLVSAYYEENGDIRIPADYVSDGHHLFQWMNRQRHAHNRGELSPEQEERLENLGIEWDFLIDRSTWDQKYDAAVEYYEEHGDLNIVQGYITEDGFPLGRWVKAVRYQYNAGELAEDNIKKMEAIGIVWRPNDEKVDQRWMNAYKILLDYMDKKGTNDIPTNAVWQDFKIGQWMQHVRYQYSHKDNPEFKKKKLSKEKIELLKESGVLLAKDEWMKCFNVVKAWYDEHGNLDIPDDVEADGLNVRSWLLRQRQIRAGKMKATSITPEHIELLDSIGYEWRTRAEIYAEHKANMFKLCEKYYKEHGDLDVPVNYTVDGVDLGRWVRSRKAHNDRLSEEEKKQYESIGITWSASLIVTPDTTDRWERNYRAAEKYKKLHGNLDVPRDYIDENMTGKLRVWLDSQKYKKRCYDAHIDEVRAGRIKLEKTKMLTDYQVNKLTELGLFDE